MIESGYKTRVTPAAFISAIKAYAKINSSGEWVDKTGNVNSTKIRDIFIRMSRAEMLRYAERGELPAWFPHDTILKPLEDTND